MTRFGQIALIFAVAMAGCSSSSTPSVDIDPHQALPGKCGWEGSNDCEEAPLEIGFSRNGKRMHVSHSPQTEGGSREPRRTANYTVLAPTENGLAMLMDGEDRLDPSGRPVTWDLILLSNDEYCWHRSDWRATGCTKSINRCEI